MILDELTAAHFHLLFEWMGTLAFAITGGLEAIRRKMDLSGALLLGFVTGTGGGTARDLILHQPVFWTQHPVYIYSTLLVAGLVFLFYRKTTVLFRQKQVQQTLLWMDALGLVAFTIDGLSKALLIHEPWIVCIMMGTLSAVGGGILRDILSNEVPLIMRGQLYATPTVAGGIGYLAVLYFFHSDAWAMTACGVIVLVLRILGMYRNWHLPMIPDEESLPDKPSDENH